MNADTTELLYDPFLSDARERCLHDNRSIMSESNDYGSNEELKQPTEERSEVLVLFFSSMKTGEDYKKQQ